MKKNDLAMALFSRRSLTEFVAREQISALSNFNDGLLRPNKCSEFEPIRTPFDPADISKPVQWLSKIGGEFFYRTGKPTYASGEMWNLSRPPTARFPSPLFTNYWTGQFDEKWALKIGVERIESFVSEMFHVTSSDFAFLTSGIDLIAKNRIPGTYSYKGMDLTIGVPGLYWINFFSSGYAEWLGIANLPKQLGKLKQLSQGGMSLRFCDFPDHCRSLEVLQRQRAAIKWLGAEKFFDIRFPDRKAVTPDWSLIPLQCSAHLP